MSLIRHKLAAATAVAAAISLSAAPAAAIGLPRVAGQGQAWDADALNVAEHGRRGHHGHWGHDDLDIDGDDILAGVLILGGIAAISAIANSGKRHEPVYRQPESYPEPESDYQAPARDDRYRSGGMAEAVDVCVAEIEAGRGPVSSVDRASRSGEGWYVAGELDGGTPYTCWIDGNGRVTDIETDTNGASYDAPEDGAEGDDGGYATVQKQAVDGVAGDDGELALAQAAD